jgi:hypothetical protein
MKRYRVVSLLVSFLFCVACGVKGRPLPPKNPRDIGIGKPVYKGVDEELKDSAKKKNKVKK